MYVFVYFLVLMCTALCVVSLLYEKCDINKVLIFITFMYLAATDMRWDLKGDFARTKWQSSHVCAKEKRHKTKKIAKRVLHVLINEMQIPRVYLQSGNSLDLCNDTVKINKKDLLDNLGEIH